MKTPLVSIIIVNFNGKLLLKNCISSILKNDYFNYEIIIVDNCSTDGSEYLIKKNFTPHLSKIKFIKLTKNFGPSYARNMGFRQSQGKFLAFLDNDTEVDKFFITKAIKLFDTDTKIGAIQCKLLLLDNKKHLDYAGELLGNLGFLRSIAKYQELDRGQYDQNNQILSAKSAGMLIRRVAFIDAGMFDPDYFIFMEETDLGWRTLLVGYKNIFCPESVVYHKFSSTRDIVDPDFNNYLVRFHGTKNYIQTHIKNLSSKYLLKILPIHIFLWFCLATYLLLTGKFKSAKNIYKGIFWNFTHLKQTLKKRKIIQKNRKLSDTEIFINQGLMSKTKLSYYLKNFFSTQKHMVTPENN